MNWINKKRNRKGFTLVELVVVIAILGILAGIAVPKLSKSRENAAIAAHNANVRTLESAATMYIAEDGDNISEDADGNIDNTVLMDYVQSWPSVPDLIKDKEAFEDNGTDTGKELTGKVAKEYTVTIKNGEIKVDPPKLKGLK